MEGFFGLQHSSVVRNVLQRLVTRAFALGPTLFFAVYFSGSSKMDYLNHLINISQAGLSFVAVIGESRGVCIGMLSCRRYASTLVNAT